MLIEIDFTERLYLIGQLTSEIDRATPHLGEPGVNEVIELSKRIRQKLIDSLIY